MNYFCYKNIKKKKNSLGGIDINVLNLEKEIL